MTKKSHRKTIVDAGLELMLHRGFSATSVRDVVASAGVPQGSFTNHFRSKNDFAIEVLDAYFDRIRKVLGETLGQRGLPPRERLAAYLEAIASRLGADEWKRGCLVGDLSLEAPGVNDVLHARLRALIAEWRRPFVECVSEGQQDGSIRDDFSAEDLADFFLSSWQGAIMRMKVEGTPEALDRFRKIVFKVLI